MATQDYVLNGTTTFTFPFAVRSASVLTLELVPGGVVSTGDYTVLGAGPTSTGVTVTYPNAPTSATTVLRITRYVQPDRVTTLNGPSDITVSNLNAEFDNAYDAIDDFQVAGVNIAQAVIDAEAAEAAAQAAQAAAEAAAAGVSLPSIVGGDTGKILRVNGAEDGYELTAALLDNEVTAAKLATNIQVPVLLSTTAITAAASIDLATAFSANPSYRYFMVAVEGAFLGAGADTLCLRVSIDGSTFRSTAGDYDWFYSQQDSTEVALSSANSSSDTHVQLGAVRLTTDSGDLVLRVADPHNTIHRKSFAYDRNHATGTTKVIREFGVGGFLATADDITGVQLFWESGGSFAAGGSVKVYGSNTPF